MRRWLAALALLALPAAADAPPTDRVVAGLSQSRVAITAGFEGLEILVFGAIASGQPQEAGPLGVVVTVVGPSQPVTVRRKDRVAGLWLNVESIRVSSAPSFYAVASSGPLADTISRTDDLRYRVSLEHALRQIEAADTVAPREAFLDAILRLRRDAGLYVLRPGGVRVDEGLLFRTTVPLPANIVEGVYTAQVLLTRDRAVIDSFSAEIDVRKAGLERLIYDTSRNAPLLYGVLSILVAMAAGFGASEVFRVLKR
jgi:uncharacterized protein (TIGR02186 family)